MDPKNNENLNPDTELNACAKTDTPADKPARSEEEHTHSNYRFALKVLLVLLSIILIIVILQSSGISVAIRDWLFCAVPRVSLPFFPRC